MGPRIFEMKSSGEDTKPIMMLGKVPVILVEFDPYTGRPVYQRQLL